MNLVGHIDEISRTRVIGWAADIDNLNDPCEIAIVVNGVELSRCFANNYRPGLTEALGVAGTGNYEFIFEFKDRLSLFEEYEISVVCVDDPSRLLSGSITRLSTINLPPAAITPVIINSAGRSGSTLLMQYLASHPQLILADEHPYEIKLTAYYVSALKVLMAEEDRTRSTHPDKMFVDENEFRVGSNPYYNPILLNNLDHSGKLLELLSHDVPQRMAIFFRGILNAFYLQLRCVQGKNAAAFFAEKGVLDTEYRKGLRRIYNNVKEIILVRDARDLVCSAIVFWGRTFDDVVSDLEISLNKICDIYLGGGEGVLILNYELLVENPDDALSRVFDFIGIDTLLTIPEVKTDNQHITSAAGASVARWRNDLTDLQVKICNERLGRFQEIFGYSTSNEIAHDDENRSSDAATGGETTSRSKALRNDELFLKFESLGENCEFGLVQRHFGAEPLGLLRWASAPLPKLLSALEAGFDGFGNPSSLSVELSNNRQEYMVSDAKFGFYYHAWVAAGEMSTEAIHEREVRRSPFLVRKLIEDLSTDNKIFVYHGMEGLSEADARCLSEALRRFGEPKLLWVELADAKHPVGSITLVEDGLWRASIDRFAPGNNAHDASFDVWRDLCARAVELIRGV